MKNAESLADELAGTYGREDLSDYMFRELEKDIKKIQDEAYKAGVKSVQDAYEKLEKDKKAFFDSMG